MKKVLFLQIKGNSYGGVSFVNKALAESFVNYNYDVSIVSVRDSFSNVVLDYDSRVKVSIVNKKDKWEIVHFCDVLTDLKNFSFLSSLKKFFIMLKDRKKLYNDYNYIKKYICDNKFDYIICSHYQLLDAIPEDYLKRTIHVHHSAFRIAFENKSNRNYFEKYKDKITMMWLTKATSEEAKKHGYYNSYYIYNPVKFNTDERANVVKNKKLITIARISYEKRIDLMIDMVDDIFKRKEFDGWSLEIYGDGPCKEEIMKKNFNKDKIKFMGVTSDVKAVLLKSSINLNTSLFEGFAMGILEGNECGVPTISFNFGESISEEIINQKTGIYVDQDEIELYKKELIKLMNNSNKLEKMSIECKNFSKKFQINNITEEWTKLFKIIDKKDG